MKKPAVVDRKAGLDVRSESSIRSCSMVMIDVQAKGNARETLIVLQYQPPPQAVALRASSRSSNYSLTKHAIVEDNAISLSVLVSTPCNIVC